LGSPSSASRLTREAFDRFLCWLAPDRQEAGMKYEQIRKKLVGFFTWRGCHDPEELFDETVDRVIKKIALEDAECFGKPLWFCIGVARNVVHEYWRAPRLDPFPDDRPFAAHGPDWKEHEFECLDRCLDQLGRRDRDLIIRYYEGEGRARVQQRREMALEVGGVNVLRLRVFRILARLRKSFFEDLRKIEE
jgi:DNA-directed RNA polymerase specialized sigma24 family protein